MDLDEAQLKKGIIKWEGVREIRRIQTGGGVNETETKTMDVSSDKSVKNSKSLHKTNMHKHACVINQK